jgi:hypothetical protein
LISSARLEGSSFDYRYVNVIGWVRKLDSDLEDTWKRSAPTRTTLGSFNPPGRGVYLQPRAHQRGFHFSPIPQARRSLVWGRVRASGYDQVLLRAYISYPNPIESPGTRSAVVALPFRVFASPLLSAIRIFGGGRMVQNVK